MSTITWEEPPPERQGAPTIPAAELARRLRDRPLEWARVGIRSTKSGAASAANVISGGKVLAWLPAGSFEACSRTVWVTAGAVPHIEYRTYARYVGAQDV